MKKIFKVMFISGMLLTVAGCKKNNNIEEKEEFQDYYVCEKLMEFQKFDEETGEYVKVETENENNEMKNYSVNYVYYKDDLVKIIKPYIKIKYFSEEIYKNIIKEEEFMKDKTKDDEDLSISYSAGNETDMTHDVDGNEQNTKIDDYITNLRKMGYKCEKIK